MHAMQTHNRRTVCSQLHNEKRNNVHQQKKACSFNCHISHRLAVHFHRDGRWRCSSPGSHTPACWSPCQSSPQRSSRTFQIVREWNFSKTKENEACNVFTNSTTVFSLPTGARRGEKLTTSAWLCVAVRADTESAGAGRHRLRTVGLAGFKAHSPHLHPHHMLTDKNRRSASQIQAQMRTPRKVI